MTRSVSEENRLGTLIATRVDGTLLRRIDQHATSEGLNRSEALRRLIDAGTRKIED